MKKTIVLMIALVLCLGLAVSAQATTLTGNLTADDGFIAHISTNDYWEDNAAQIGTGNSWQATYQLTQTTLTESKYYLHIKAFDQYGTISGFLGDFNLNGTGYQFANGTTSLLTGSSSWKVSSNGSAGTYSSSFDQVFKNGQGIWGSVHGGAISGISPDAYWIWTNKGNCSETPRYFSAEITAVPEPGTILAALSILAPAGMIFRRRK